MAALTPEIAADLMQRSMTTGVPTSEFDKYGGYDAVMDLYNANNGSYSLQDLDPGFLDQAAQTIMDQGYGNLATLREADVPLTTAARSKFDFTDQQLKDMNIPYEGFLQVPKRATTVSGTATQQPTDITPRVMGPLPGGTSSNGAYNTWRAGAAGNGMLGAGNADYHSELLKSLRQSSINPISNNQGVQFMQNRGSSNADWKPPTIDGNAAFNPQVLNPRAASPQEVADWNAYSTYRTNSLNSKTPIVSFTEWLAGGKSDGKAPTAPPATNDEYLYWA